MSTDLLPEGPTRRRHFVVARVSWFHSWHTNGTTLSQVPRCRSPVVVWEGSNEIIRAHFSLSLSTDQILRMPNVAPEQWGNLDVTEIYHHTRRNIFDQCLAVLKYLRGPVKAISFSQAMSARRGTLGSRCGGRRSQQDDLLFQTGTDDAKFRIGYRQLKCLKIKINKHFYPDSSQTFLCGKWDWVCQILDSRVKRETDLKFQAGPCSCAIKYVKKVA